MIEIIDQRPPEQISILDIDFFSNNKIYLAEKGVKQAILTHSPDGGYFFRSFYLDQTNQKTFNYPIEAIQDVMKRGYKVYILCSKTELKEMIKVGKLRGFHV